MYVISKQKMQGSSKLPYVGRRDGRRTAMYGDFTVSLFEFQMEIYPTLSEI